MRRRRLTYLALFLLGGCLFLVTVFLLRLNEVTTSQSREQRTPLKEQIALRGDVHDELLAHQQLANKVAEVKNVNLPAPIHQTPICSPVVEPMQVAAEVWQHVQPPPSTLLYVYSAFYDKRDVNNPMIRVIGAVDNTHPPAVFCQLWSDPKFTDMTAIGGRLVTIPEGAGRRYTAVYIECPLPAKMAAPYAVSVTDDKCRNPVNMMPVIQIPTEPLKTRTFAVCVTPFNLAYDKVDQFIETVEVNRLLGANHIFFYNHTTSARMRLLVDKYVADGYATVLQWALPMKVHIWPVPPGYVEDIKYFAQMASLNDCLMRTMGQYKYTVFSDMDELLIPREDNNWHELFDKLEKRNGATTAWTFRNTFFKTEWPSDPAMESNTTIAELKAMTLLKVRRETSIQPAGSRSKLIVNPFGVVQMGVHNVWQFAHGSDAVLDENEGLCHHYRFWEGMGEKTFVFDRNVFRLREAIVAIVGKARKDKLTGII